MPQIPNVVRHVFNGQHESVYRNWENPSDSSLIYVFEAPSKLFRIKRNAAGYPIEYAEATTDNVPTPGSNPDFPQAWNDAAGFEVGDKCGGRGTLTSGAGTWTVTQYYLNSKHACSVGNYTSP